MKHLTHLIQQAGEHLGAGCLPNEYQRREAVVIATASSSGSRGVGMHASGGKPCHTSLLLQSHCSLISPEGENNEPSIPHFEGNEMKAMRQPVSNQ